MMDVKADSSKKENEGLDIHEEEFRYGQDHELQSVTVYARDNPTTSQLWLIYIHGGAWRDPLVTSASFRPTIQRLLTSAEFPDVSSKVASFASINYRLSAHPSFPQTPASIPAQTYRNAKHPDHIRDVCTALSFLQAKYKIEDQYMLVGHSCGATLAMQIIMGKDFLQSCGIGPENLDFKLPQYVLGVAGIYNLRLLRDTNSHPAYNEFLTGAFGADEKVWDEVSPARFVGYSKSWKEGKVLAFATSENDELVDALQIDEMIKCVNGFSDSKGGLVKNLKGELKKGHDEIWMQGELAEVVGKTLKLCD